MIVIEKGSTNSLIYPTISENINRFPNDTFDPLLLITDDQIGTTYSIYPLTDLSNSPIRYNLYLIDETIYDFKLGQHTYEFYISSTSSNILEVGKFNVIGTVSSTFSAYYDDIYQ